MVLYHSCLDMPQEKVLFLTMTKMIIERIGTYRTEQAKLATRRLVVIRDNLTAAQREKATAILDEEQKKRREERERNTPANRPAAPKGW